MVDELGTSRKREVHRGLALAMELVGSDRAEYVDPGEIARHAEHAGEKAMAYRFAMQAVESCERRLAFDDALGWLDFASAVATHDDRSRRRESRDRTLAPDLRPERDGARTDGSPFVVHSRECERELDSPTQRGAHAMTDPSRSARFVSLLVGLVLMFTAAATTPRRAEVPLASLDLAKMKVQPGGGRGGQQTVAQANKSIDGNPIHIGGQGVRHRRRHARQQRAFRAARRRRRAISRRWSARTTTRFKRLPARRDNRPHAASADPDRLPCRRRRTGSARQQAGRRAAMRRSRSTLTCAALEHSYCRSTQVDVVRPVVADWADAKFTVERRRAGRDRHPDRAARSPHAQAGSRAAHQRSFAHRRDARPRRPLQDSRDRHRARSYTARRISRRDSRSTPRRGSFAARSPRAAAIQ